MGTATSSMITAVPVARIAPTEGKAPLRTAQYCLIACGSSVKAAGSIIRMSASVAPTAATRAASAPASAARVSISSAAAPSGSAARFSGIPGWFSTARRLSRSISSTASTGCVLSAMVASQAARMSGNSASAAALNRGSATV